MVDVESKLLLEMYITCTVYTLVHVLESNHP